MNRAIGMIGKGGDAKSTTCAALGDALARLTGARVLLVDLDPQGGLTEWLARERVGVGVEGLLTGKATHLINAVLTVRAATEVAPGHVHLLPTWGGLNDLDPAQHARALRTIVQKQAAEYDYVFLDTQAFQPVGERVTWHHPAMLIATDVLVALQAKPMSVRVLKKTNRSLKQIAAQREERGQSLSYYYLPTQVRGTRTSRDLLEGLKAGLTVLTEIPAAVAMEDAVAEQKLPLDYDAKAKPVAAYETVAKELLAAWDAA